MCHFLHCRWLPVLCLLFAVPAAPQDHLAYAAAPEGPAAASASVALPTAPVAPPTAAATLPKLTPEQVGDIYEVREHYQAAIQSYQKVEQPSPILWNKMGIAYQMMFALKGAEHCYKESLKLNPNNPDVLNNLATVEDLLRDFSSGERNYRRALKLNPNSALVLKNLGTNLLMQHQYDKGNQAYQQALVIDPHIFDEHFGPKVSDPAPKTERGTANYFKARSCASAGLNDCALNYLQKAFNEGSATVKKVSEDAAFASLRDTAALQRLLSNVQ